MRIGSFSKYRTNHGSRGLDRGVESRTAPQQLTLGIVTIDTRYALRRTSQAPDLNNPGTGLPDAVGAAGRAQKVRAAKSHGQEKRGTLSETAPVVRPLDAKRNNRISNHEKIVAITRTTLDSVMQLSGAFQ